MYVGPGLQLAPHMNIAATIAVALDVPCALVTLAPLNIVLVDAPVPSANQSSTEADEVQASGNSSASRSAGGFAGPGSDKWCCSSYPPECSHDTSEVTAFAAADVGNHAGSVVKRASGRRCNRRGECLWSGPPQKAPPGLQHLDAVAYDAALPCR
jgi:hypothetical protein